MTSELLFFAVLGGYILLTRKKENTFVEYIRHPLYLSWMFMSISIFDYTPSVLQYAIRAGSMGFSVIAIMQTKKRLIAIKKGAIGVLWIYIVLCFVSTFWSVDMLQTAIKACELAIDMLLIGTIIRSEEPKKAVYKLLYVLLSVCVLIESYVAIGCIVMHSTFITVSKGVFGVHLTGGIVSADSLGGISVFIIICLLNMSEYKKRYLFLILAIAELFLCQARTSLASFVIIMAIYLFRTKRKGLYFLVAFVVAVIAYLKWDWVIAYFLRGSDVTNLQTMSGRTIMWNNAIKLIKEKPLFGYGFGSGGEMVSSLNNGMTSLHSGIYECLMGVGAVGFALVIIAYVIVIIQLIKNIVIHGLKNNSIELMLLCDLTIRTYMSTGIGGWHSHVLMIWLVLVAMETFLNQTTLTNYMRTNGILNLK